MAQIEYRIGNLFDQLPTDKNVVICHVVNDKGGWGKGFVVPLGKRFPEAKKRYLEWFRLEKPNPPFELGNSQTIHVASNIVVVNMLAQHGYISHHNKTPLSCDALVSCLYRLKNIKDTSWRDDNVEIHAPAFGTGLAGGDWRIISTLIKLYLENFSKIYIYTLTQEQQDTILAQLNE